MREKSETRIVKVYNNNIKSEQEEMFGLFTDYLLGIQMQSANNDSGIV